MSWETKSNMDVSPVSIEDDLQSIFKPAVDLETPSFVHMGIYGRSNTGKTTFALSCPRPCYIIDTENSVKENLVAYSMDFKANLNVAEVLEYANKVEGKIDLTKSLNMLFKATDVITSVVSKSSLDPTLPIGTIVIDSCTDVWDWLSIWLEENTTKIGKDQDRIMRTEWGKANRKYTEFMYMLLASKWNVVFTFRSRPAVNSKGEDLGYDNPRWQKNTEHWLTISTEMKLEGLDRVMYFRKCRWGDISQEIINPAWETFTSHISSHTGVKLSNGD